jgi:hypothetical protein
MRSGRRERRVDAVIGWLDLLFGKGDSDHALWLTAVRVDILVFVLCSVVLLAWSLSPGGRRWAYWTSTDVATVAALTAIAALLRCLVEHNLSDLGGIGYSRILLGYKGHFATAQLYSLVYARTARDLEHAILLNRVASTLTVPLLYALCRRLAPASPAFATITAAMLALHPLHVLFTPTDALPISTSFLAAASYLLLVNAIEGVDSPHWARTTAALGAAAGLALLTQVRYENLLFLLPPALYLLARRRAHLRPLLPGAIVFALLMVLYAVEALRAGTSFQNPVALTDAVQGLGRELLGNPIFAIVPVLAGTAAALLYRRSAVRALALLPLLAVLPLGALVSAQGHHLARTYVNQVLLLTLVAGYGLALLWESRRRAVRVLVVACLIWTAALPLLFWVNFRERHLDTAEHDFLRAALAALPAGIDRVVVPDDERLYRETHSTIESMTKYRMIADSAGARVDVVGVTPFLEGAGEIDCSRGNCAFFRGVPCQGLQRYWFADSECAQVMATRAGAALIEEDVTAGSFVDCSVYRGAARRRLCEPMRTSRRLGIYRIDRGPLR